MKRELRDIQYVTLCNGNLFCFAESIGCYWLQALGRYEHELRCAINFSGTGVRLLGISSIERDADLGHMHRQRVFQLYSVVNCLATWTDLAGSCFQPLVWVPLQWWVLLRSAEFDGEERRHVRHNAPVGTDSGWLLVRNCKGRSRLRPTWRCRQGVKFAARDTQVHGND